MFVRKGFVLIFSAILLSACTFGEKERPISEEPVVETSEADTSKRFQLQSPELPTTIDEVVQYPAGPFSSSYKKEDLQKVLKDIPALPEDASDEELTELSSYLYSLFKKEYPDLKEGISTYSINEKESSKKPNQEEEQRTLNVEIILDSSGSMGNYMDGKTRMELAKESIKKFAASLPEEANVSLRVYGHKGTGKAADKEMSCSANELVYSPQPYDKEKMNEALKSFQPAGWTPLAASLMKAQEDLAPYKGENHKNIVYVVSDGIETCGGDPIHAAEELKNSGIAPIVHVIGFDLSSQDQKQLEEIAKAAGGTYTNVKNQKQLQSEFEKTAESAIDWLNWKYKESINILNHSFNQSINLSNKIYKWNLTKSKERIAINDALTSLVMNKKITFEQRRKIGEMYEEFYNNLTKQVNELRDAISNAEKEAREKNFEKLDEAYRENVAQ